MLNFDTKRLLQSAVIAGLVLVLIASSVAVPGGRSSPPGTGNSSVTDQKAVAKGLPVLPGTDSPTYMRSSFRQASSPSETVLNATNAANLGLLWSFPTGGPVFSSPALVNGVAYFGSYDGYEYAVAAESGQLIWKTFLGQDPFDCGPAPAGVVSSATVSNGVVYLGGGDAHWYALSAQTGQILWNLTVGTITQGYFAWSSPLLVGTNMYIGIASQCDKPLVPASLMEINLGTHAVVNTFNTTLNSTLGASIWGSPTYDPWDNTVFVTTGNPGNQSGSVPYSESLLKLNATNLHLVGQWQVPKSQVKVDGDFGTTPDLALPKVGAPVVIAVNKNGYIYAFNASNPSVGPIWQTRLTIGGFSIAPATWGGGHYYIGGANTTVNGLPVAGSLRSVNPYTGKIAWIRGEPADIWTAPFWANGLVVVASGHHIDVVNAVNGKLLKALVETKNFQAAPIISHGEILVGSTDGRLYSFGLPDTASVAVNRSVGVAPLSVQFTGTASGGFPPYAWSWNFGDGSPLGTTPQAGHTYATSGSYRATLIVTDHAGLTANASVSVTVVSPLAANITSEEIADTNFEFQAQTSGGLSPFNFTWSIGGQVLGWGPTLVYNFTSPGNYTMNLTAVDSLGEVARAQLAIQIVTQPVAPGRKPSLAGEG